MKDYIYLGFVLDRSGSMGMDNKIDEARNGFNKILKEKKSDKEFTYDSVVTIFDDTIEKLYEGRFNKAPKLTKDTFYARGMTSLYDAIGTTVSSIKKNIKKMEKAERPEKVLITVITDGMENNSKEYNQDSIKELIKKQKKKDWEFVFMGTTEESATSAVSLGFGMNKTVIFQNSTAGTKDAFDLMSCTVSNYSSGDFKGYSSRSASDSLTDMKNKTKVNMTAPEDDED